MKNNVRSIKNLKKGNPGNKGGTGRPSNWFREEMAKIASHPKAIEFLKAVVTGKPVEERTLLPGTDKEMKVMISASVKDRVTAWEKTADRGFDKPIQGVVQLKFVIEFTASVAQVLNKNIPDACPHCKKPLSLREATVKELETLSKQFEEAKVV